MVFQLQIARCKEAIPRTRDYMVDWERSVQPSSAGIAGRQKRQA
jgi:hypothetical protein